MASRLALLPPQPASTLLSTPTHPIFKTLTTQNQEQTASEQPKDPLLSALSLLLRPTILLYCISINYVFRYSALKNNY